MGVSRLTRAARPLTDYTLIAWDFDGVVKDSVNVREDVFGALFAGYREGAGEAAKACYRQCPQMRRWTQIERALRVLGHAEPSRAYIELLRQRYVKNVEDAVVRSPWVSGVREYLGAYHRIQHMVIATGIRQREIDSVAKRLEIASWFEQIYGFPTSKAEAIAFARAELGVARQDCLMIGDSLVDYQAARRARVDFRLRVTSNSVPELALEPCIPLPDLAPLVRARRAALG